VGGVAFWAHAGGFAAGLVLHRLFLLSRRDSPRRFEADERGIEGAWMRQT
jgi:membrane associated rhomboid family serine protease